MPTCAVRACRTEIVRNGQVSWSSVRLGANRVLGSPAHMRLVLCSSAVIGSTAGPRARTLPRRGIKGRAPRPISTKRLHTGQHPNDPCPCKIISQRCRGAVVRLDCALPAHAVFFARATRVFIGVTLNQFSSLMRFLQTRIAEMRTSLRDPFNGLDTVLSEYRNPELRISAALPFWRCQSGPQGPPFSIQWQPPTAL